MKKEEIPQFLTFTGKDGKDRIYDFADKEDVYNFLRQLFYEKELEDAAHPVCTVLSIPKDAELPDEDLNPFELMQKYGEGNNSVSLIQVLRSHDIIEAQLAIDKEGNTFFPAVEGWQEFIPEQYRPFYFHLEEGFYMMMHATKGMLRTPTETAQRLLGAMMTRDTATVEEILTEANIIARALSQKYREDEEE